ncbi:MAG: ferredoxin family protein [Clostridiales bacterium]|nr:ferredoxin family protein [Clostridiales bacterium]
MAKITIDKVYCKGCDICLSACPKKIFVRSKKRNNYGSNMPEAQNADECVVCRMCERMCPDGAINVEGEVKNEA